MVEGILTIIILVNLSPQGGGMPQGKLKEAIDKSLVHLQTLKMNK